MSDEQVAIGAPPATRAGRAARRASAYARLGKLHLWQMFLTIPVAWTLLPRHVALSRTGLVTMALFLVCVVGNVSAALALDDVVGARIGMDRVTYGSTEQLLRSARMKPLLLGELTDAQALRFGWTATALGTLAGTLAVLLSWHPWSPWALVVLLFVAFVTVQYSYGIRFSFRLFAGAEIVLLIGFTAAVVLPYWMLIGPPTPRTLLEALLMALWMMQIGIFSNSADAPHDRVYGRSSVPARVAERVNRSFIAGVFALGWAITAGGILAGWLPAWLAVALLPAWFLQARQLLEGIGRRRYLLARRLGFHVYELAPLALILTNLLQPQT
jgi:1,4-dihydroxy-2-naphthoate polyprenyltransferase